MQPLKMAKYAEFSARLLYNIFTRHRTRTIIVVLFISLFSVYSSWNYIQPPLYVFVNKDVNSKCVLPKLDVNDPSIMKFYNWHPPPIECDTTQSFLHVDFDGVLHFHDKITTAQREQMKCTYSIISSPDDDNVEFLSERAFTPPISINNDLFLIKCRNSENKIIYENLHHKVFPKPRNRFRNDSVDDLSVLVFGIDSVSRLAALRKLPKTVEYIENVLEGYIFKGFNKVGDHTFPNLISMFTGRLHNKWPVDLATDHCDKFPFIWSNFSSENNYVTMFAEDWPEIATFNQVLRKGFSKPPTDHYMRPFWLAMRKIKPLQHDTNLVFQYLESKNINLGKRSSMCYGNTPNHMLIINYFKQFLAAYKGTSKFTFAWLNELAHNFVNFIELGDNDFYEFLKWMYEGQHLENTMLIFFSDHGSRVDEVRNTYAGRIEDRMPFVSMVLPKKFKERYPKIHRNVLNNTEKLTSTFDLFQTFSDVLHKSYTNPSYYENIHTDSKKESSISLFREIPEDRSCADAGILEHYCACYASRPLEENRKQTLAKYLLGQINGILEKVKDKCAVLKLKDISNAEILSNNLQRQEKDERFTLWNMIFSPEDSREEIYRVTIETIPGNALFEATIKKSGEDNSLQIVEDISRINLFGNQTRCMKDRMIRDYCFCL